MSLDKDTIIKLARLVWGDLPIDMASPAEIDRLERFAQAIYKQGLEDAANEADRFLTSGRSPHGMRVAAAIRALGEQHE